MAAILELIADEAETTRDFDSIGESARRKLAPSICSSLAGSGNVIRAAALSMVLEARIAGAMANTERGPIIGFEPPFAVEFAQKLQAFERTAAQRAVIVCSQSLRLALARFIEAVGVDIAVLGLAEVVPGYTVHVVETIGSSEALYQSRIRIRIERYFPCTLT